MSFGAGGRGLQAEGEERGARRRRAIRQAGRERSLARGRTACLVLCARGLLGPQETQ